MEIEVKLGEIGKLDEVLEVAEKVFKPTSEEKLKYHNKDKWMEKIISGGLLVTGYVDKQLVGFGICYPDGEKFHIWNVGVLEEYRKFGVWKKMYERIVDRVKEKGFKHISLNTIKNKFVGMYNFVIQNGFVEYKTEGEKSFFVKNL